MSAAAVLAESGLVDEGLAELARIEQHSDDLHRGRVKLQAAYILHHAGRLIEALEYLDAGERLLVAAGEPRDRLRLFGTRGLVLLQQGRFDAADADFVESENIAESLGMTGARAQYAANRGVLHGRARRLATAVGHFERAAALFDVAGNPARTVAVMRIDQAEVLMYSGLVSDAVDAAHQALQLVEPSGNRVVLGDALLMLARTQLAARRLREAVRTSAAAHELFAASGRPDMLAHARFVGAYAELLAAGSDPALVDALDTAAAVIVDLRGMGWDRLADDLAVARLRAAHGRRMTGPVADDIAQLRLGAFDKQRDLALVGWYAEAIARLDDGEPEGAVDACRSGLGLLDDIVAEATTLEQRSATMRIGSDLSQLIIDIAVAQGDAATALAAAEGTRARALHDELVEARRHRPLTGAGAEQLARELTARLDDRVLVEWVITRDRVVAIVVESTSTRLVDVGDVGTIRRERDRVLIWLDRAASEPDESSQRAVRAIAMLDELLIAPLGLQPAQPVVLVPVGMLHGVPWSGLPSLAGRSTSLAPNAQVWLAADRRAIGTVSAVGLVVGPDVSNAEVERAAVERAHPRAAVAAGHGATAATVRSMFANLDVVHVAAHGRFRSDRPLLSVLRLEGGDATLHESVPSAVRARLVVLSSCEGGLQGTSDGAEVLGFAAVMLARGASTVLAPLTVVRELECADFVADVHCELSQGRPIGAAVAEVRSRWLLDDDLSRWAVASSFTCFGSDAVTVAAG